MSKFTSLVIATAVTTALTACGQSKKAESAPEAQQNPIVETVVATVSEASSIAKELAAFDFSKIQSLSEEALNSLTEKVNRLVDLDTLIDSDSNLPEAQAQLKDHKDLISQLRNAINLEISKRKIAQEQASSSTSAKSSTDSLYDILEQKLKNILKKIQE